MNKIKVGKTILFFENSYTFGFIVIKSKMCKNEQTT